MAEMDEIRILKNKEKREKMAGRIEKRKGGVRRCFIRKIWQIREMPDARKFSNVLSRLRPGMPENKKNFSQNKTAPRKERCFFYVFKLFTVNGNFFLAAFFFLRFRNKDFQNTIFKVGFGIIKLQIPGQRDGSFE